VQTFAEAFGFISTMQGWGSIGAEGVDNKLTSFKIEIIPKGGTGTHTGSWYTIIDYSSSTVPLSLQRGIIFKLSNP